MKKLISFLLVVGLIAFCSSAVADSTRTEPLSTSGVLTSSQDVASRGIDIYRIMVNGTAATSGVALYNAAVGASGAPDVSNCVFEIYEATSGEGHYIDFGENPLRLDTGCYIQMFDAAVVLHYR